MEESVTLMYFQSLLDNRLLFEAEDQKALTQAHDAIERNIFLHTVTPNTKVTDKSLSQMKRFLTVSKQLNRISGVCTTQKSTALSERVLSLYQDMQASFTLRKESVYRQSKNDLLEQLAGLKISQLSDLNLLAKLRPFVADLKLRGEPSINVNNDYLCTLLDSLPEGLVSTDEQPIKSLTLSQLHDDILSIDDKTDKSDIDVMSQAYQRYLVIVQKQLLQFNKTDQLMGDLFQFTELTETLLGAHSAQGPRFSLLTIDRSITNSINALNDAGVIPLKSQDKAILNKIDTFYHNNFINAG